MTRLRVLHVGKYYYPFRGGVEKTVQILAEGLGRDHDVEVAVANDGQTTRVEDVNGIRVTRLGRWFDFVGAPFCPGLSAYLKENFFDVVHIHLPNPFAEIAYLLARPSGRLVVTYHSDIVRQKALFWFYRPFQRCFLRRADRIIATAKNNIERSGMLSVFREKCEVVSSCIEPDDFVLKEGGAIDVIRREFGPRIVLSVGRLVYYKGFEHAVRAMRHVPDARLIIIGRGPLKKRLETLAMEIGVEGRVSLLDQVEDIVPYYHACDVFILPSVAVSEAFGLVQLEAMAAGKPVINTALPSGVVEVSLHGETGLTVPPGDEEALAGAIRRFLDDPGLRAVMGQAGVRRVRAYFSNQKAVEQTARIYAQVCAL